VAGELRATRFLPAMVEAPSEAIQWIVITVVVSRRIVARGPGVATGGTPTVLPALLYQQDPMRLSVQRLGRKWTLLILRDLAFLKLSRFSQLQKNNPGLTPRVLARRLREMEDEGLIRRSAGGRTVTYSLTPRGEDAVYILLAFLRYGLRHFVGPQPMGGVGRPAVAQGRPHVSVR
jgi:DNA-binding HxlR family transcriptional regulator